MWGESIRRNEKIHGLKHMLSQLSIDISNVAEAWNMPNVSAGFWQWRSGSLLDYWKRIWRFAKQSVVKTTNSNEGWELKAPSRSLTIECLLRSHMYGQFQDELARHVNQTISDFATIWWIGLSLGADFDFRAVKVATLWDLQKEAYESYDWGQITLHIFLFSPKVGYLWFSINTYIIRKLRC